MSSRAVLSVLMVVLFTNLGAGQEKDLEKARREVAEAKERREEAGSNLATRYVLLRADFEFLRSDRWPLLSGPYVDAVESARARREADPDADVVKTLTGAFRQAALLSEQGADLLAAEVAKALREAPSEDPEQAEPRGVLDRATRTLFPANTFEESWAALLPRLAAVQRWKEAGETLARAEANLAALEGGPVVPDNPNAPPGMVLVPKGRFKFGPWNGWDSDLRKNAARSERVDGFFIDIHEVTNAEYREFLAGLKKQQLVKEYLAHGFERKEDGTIAFPSGTDRQPARGMTFAAANAYAKWKGKRLPTEAEWELAARGEEGHAYPWGDDFAEDATNWSGAGLGGPADVGACPKDRSPYGVMDMAGNVSELTSELDGRRPARGKLKATDSIVHRGGNYAEGKEAARATYRWVFPALSGKSETVGFRCVLSEKDWKK